MWRERERERDTVKHVWRERERYSKACVEGEREREIDSCSRPTAVWREIDNVQPGLLFHWSLASGLQ